MAVLRHKSFTQRILITNCHRQLVCAYLGGTGYCRIIASPVHPCLLCTRKIMLPHHVLKYGPLNCSWNFAALTAGLAGIMGGIIWQRGFGAPCPRARSFIYQWPYSWKVKYWTNILKQILKIQNQNQWKEKILSLLGAAVMGYSDWLKRHRHCKRNCKAQQGAVCEQSAGCDDHVPQTNPHPKPNAGSKYWKENRSPRRISENLWVLDFPFFIWSVNALPDGPLFDSVNKRNNRKIFRISKTAAGLGFKDAIHFLSTMIFTAVLFQEMLGASLCVYYRRDNLHPFHYWKKSPRLSPPDP